MHMAYDPELVKPMAEELTSLGIEALRTPEEVDKAVNLEGTTLVIVNSVCGCAAGKARPGVKLALKHSKLPNKMVTVFAGVHREATEKARSYFTGYAPSSPQMVLLKDKKVVFMLERHDIEDREAEEISNKLIDAFDEYC